MLIVSITLALGEHGRDHAPREDGHGGQHAILRSERRVDGAVDAGRAGHAGIHTAESSTRVAVGSQRHSHGEDP